MILICAATDGELACWGEPSPGEQQQVTGVGIPATWAALSQLAPPWPDLVIDIGIAGAYPDTGLVIGDIVVGTSDCYADIGFELPEPPGFQPITAVPFGAAYATPYPISVPPLLHGATLGRGATVNSCTGTRATGVLRRDLFDVTFETMEGAVFAQWSAHHHIPFYHFRAISNIAADRDMRPENIRRALAELTQFLVQWRNSMRILG